MLLNECGKTRGWNATAEESLSRIQFRLEQRVTEGAFKLTKLQQMAIDSPGFWKDWERDEPQHLMIQGATSSGKTLLAELAILDTLVHDRKAIILVPLKSMVNEKRKQFREDMPPDCRVFAASSDYMEYDERLINGEYEVAVIVYEKFFAMLSQGNHKILDNCGLLVVDELAMLSKEQRGPKLEMALERVSKNHPDVRIMCLATCDCRSEKICAWLKIDEEHRIFSSARPVALEEHILLLNGVGRYRIIPAECEVTQDCDIPEKLEEHLEIPGYDTEWRRDEQKRRLLQVVLRHLIEKDGSSRILIFVSSKREAASVASFLKDAMQELFPVLYAKQQTEEYLDFVGRLRSCEEDEGLLELLNNLVPHGIAFHHAGLSTNLRELIEAEFQKRDSFLRVIVATETLTIGVNMPFDSMIMMSSSVPRGEGEAVRLTPQEYRNFIGRAGRLGQSNRTGTSYLFLEERRDLEYFWNSYNRKEEIESALVKADEEELAPFFLSLLENSKSDTFTLDQIKDLFAESLTSVCKKEKVISAEKLYDALYNAYLADKSSKSGGKNKKEAYEVQGFGVHMAPYAFSTDTCIQIYERFFDGTNRCALPETITCEDVDSDRYLLDILYHVCRHKEIESSSVLTYPKDDANPGRLRSMKTALIRHLNQILTEKDSEGKPLYELWPDGKDDKNELKKYMTQLNLGNEASIAQAALRAVLLFYWTKGKTVREIKQITGFPVNLVSGDIERIAEIASFHLDAIQKCLGDNTNYIPDLNVTNSFYTLQCRVKYGMSRELVRLANKHVHGLDRNRLLQLEKEAQRRGMTPVVFLYYEVEAARQFITPLQRGSLLSALERRGEDVGFDTLLDMISKEAGRNLTPKQKSGIEQIFYYDYQSDDGLFDAIQEAVNDNALLPGIRVFTDRDKNRLVWMSKQEEIHIGLLPDRSAGAGDVDDPSLLKFLEKPADGHLLLAVRPKDCDNWQNEMEELGRRYACPTVFDNQFFALILAHTILKSLDKEDPVTALLKDARGVYTAAEYKYYSPENYVKSAIPSDSELVFVCNRSRSAYSNRNIDISELQGQIWNQASCAVIPWGSALDTLNDSLFDRAKVILLLEREMVARSQSLHNFVKRLCGKSFRNTLLIHSDENAMRKWNSPTALENPGECSWDGNFCGVNQVLLHRTNDAAKAALDYYRLAWEPSQFTIGVSYAHDDTFSADERAVYHSDNELLKQVFEHLKGIYGEHQILFDQYKKASGLFNQNSAREASLNAYRTCKVFLILWNVPTINNINCKYERNAIFEHCRESDSRYFYLLPTNAPNPPENDFGLQLTQNSIRSIVSEVRNSLTNL